MKFSICTLGYCLDLKLHISEKFYFMCHLYPFLAFTYHFI